MTRRYWNINLEEMMEAGVHFGHGTRKWNPRMAPYISRSVKVFILQILLELLAFYHATMLKRKLYHLQTYLGGIKYMKGLPDIVIIVDQQEEYTALRECVTLEIPTIFLIDTNCDPDLADFSIPANGDCGFQVHAQVLITSWVVIAILLGSSVIANFFEYVLEFIRDLSKTQIGEEYSPWFPLLELCSYLFLFLTGRGSFTSENNTVTSWGLYSRPGIFLCWSYQKRIGLFGKYIQPTPILLPINILEDFTKPLSLIVVVLVSLVPSKWFLYAVMFLGLFTSGIQSLIFATLAAAYIGESMEGHH
ncbi:hypothetical protein MKW92_015751 [Papaver armeniacum]|nr:hypothetical protein MKW92_015751 [Papaver armeniacum]